MLVVYDTDDLVFDPARVDEIDAYKHLPPHEQALYLDGLRRYGRSLSLCGAVTVSTNWLAAEVRRLWPEKTIAVFRNRLSQDLVGRSEAAFAIGRPQPSTVTVSHFSGTKTHQKDSRSASARCCGSCARTGPCGSWPSAISTCRRSSWP